MMQRLANALVLSVVVGGVWLAVLSIVFEMLGWDASFWPLHLGGLVEVEEQLRFLLQRQALEDPALDPSILTVFASLLTIDALGARPSGRS